MEFVIFWILCGIAASYIAGQKGKNSGTWFLLGMLLGPLALLMVGLSPAAAKSGPADSAGHFGAVQSALPTRLCPFCAEEIKHEAIVCKHCGRDVPALPAPKPESLIKKCYDSLQSELGGAMDQGRAKLELERQGFSTTEIVAFLDTLPQ